MTSRSMQASMSNLFQSLSKNIRGSSFVVWITILAFLATFIGLVHFVEDTYSSFVGLNQLESAFGLKPANYAITYFTMSIAPQVGQIIFGYMWLMDRKKNWWAGLVAVGFFGVDFVADLQYRSNGLLFPVDGSTTMDHIEAVSLSAFLTFGYFTVGSELFITAGAGLILELFNDAVDQAANIYVSLRKAIIDARYRIRHAVESAQTTRRN